MRWLLSLIWQGFLGLFGKSDAEKLGRAEEKAATQAELLKEAKDARDIENRVDAEPAGSALDWLRHHLR